MKAALKWYLITGGVLMVILVLMNFITPAISEASILLGIAEKWFGRLYSAGSIVAAAVGLAIIPNYVSVRKHKKLQTMFESFTKGDMFDAHIITLEPGSVKFHDARMTPMPVVKRIAEERTKNPAGGGIFGAGTTIWFCPVCGMFNTPTHKFCWECGQALSFEDALTNSEGVDAHD